MAITHNYTLLCEDTRQENNGKFLILGLYTPDIVVPAVPFVMPSLCFFIGLHADAVAALDFTFALRQGDTVLTAGEVKMSIVKTGETTLPLRLGGVQFTGAGPYRFVLDIGGGDQIAHDFSVLVVGQDVSPLTSQTESFH